MAAAVVAASAVPAQPATALNKRYRPAPAKTFQCRGFGDCRMVFSRSEHLARHIRKHTGERPFTCHCGKQFSRLDNLRQHAQTVHADKQDENERMMKELASLHASMSASNRAGNTRGKRAQAAAAAAAVAAAAMPDGLVKQEAQSISMHPRPGTSTGYEGTGPDHPSILYHNVASWQVPSAPGARPTSHSFRDPGQSFRAPPSSSPSTAFGVARQQHQPLTHSFLPLATGPSFSFGLPDLAAGDARPGSSSSRPPTAGGPNDGAPRSLPPLAAVVSSALASQPPPASLSQSTTRILPLPSGPAYPLLRRPSTANRPGTAPAAYYNPPRAIYDGGPGLVGPRGDLSVLGLGRGPATPGGGGLAAFAAPPGFTGGLGLCDDSPFSFHPPALTDAQPPFGAVHAPPSPSSSSNNPRKRPFPGFEHDARERREPAGGEYDYESESRPQSRRLSVMELCNDTDASPRAAVLRPVSAAAYDARPDTSSGLVTSASALALYDDAGPPLLAGAAPPAAGAAPAGAAGRGGRFVPPPPNAAPAAGGYGGAAATILSAARSPSGSPPLSSAGSSRSPRSPPFAAAVQSAA
ncbi:hypothetical protein NEOLEDRAFT_1079879 [Neolentinus lepideus HHB14362 ss-1]|uniref:C2H2-type domain-containing protein n=1 Tax=Neolentinus lepideus HHB14362 ss-1 TaxID=1314782 RepID=A0A165MMV2_9AGAM|nr:hypothetical protein NEOLEDRAFT_1079879 [Neolentinus lepideus HHB14362 ss-1]